MSLDYIPPKDGTIALSVTLAGTDAPPAYDGFGTITILSSDTPPAYDGFGTITILSSDTRRVVAISPEHLDWQEKRYGSGLFGCSLPSKAVLKSLPALILKRILNPGAEVDLNAPDLDAEGA